MGKRFLNSQKGFTLIEIVTALGIILILASVAIVVYVSFLNRAKESVCEENLKALNGAVKIYLMENEVLPAVLGDLKFEQLEKAYTKVIRDRDLFTKFSHFFLKMNTSNQAYAQFLTYENLKKYGVSEEIFHCPADENGGVSYGINGNLAGKWNTEINQGDILIGDSDNFVFVGVDQLKKRHRHGEVAMAITVEGKFKKVVESSAADDVDDDDDDHDNDDDD